MARLSLRARARYGSPDGLRHRFAAPPVPSLPFLLVIEAGGAVLIAPFAKRQNGLSRDEADRLKTVVARLRGLPPPGSVVWIDPQDGTATPASIGEGQLRRRMVDNASVSLRLRTG
jgi:hypothetical protein